MTAEHTEAVFAQRYLGAFNVEVGCGSNPTPRVQVTVDHRIDVEGEGCEEGLFARPDVCAEMGALPFRAGAFDALVARHVIEHHPDTLAVLREWSRVARRLVVVCPDQANYHGNTVLLDPTHRACFTPSQLACLAGHAGLEVAVIRPAIAGWSMLLVAQR